MVFPTCRNLLGWLRTSPRTRHIFSLIPRYLVFRLHRPRQLPFFIPPVFFISASPLFVAFCSVHLFFPEFALNFFKWREDVSAAGDVLLHLSEWSVPFSPVTPLLPTIFRLTLLLISRVV